MTADRAAPLSGVVYDVASGGVEHVPFSIQTNLSQSLEAAITVTTGLDAAAWLARHVYGTETLPAVAPVL